MLLSRARTSIPEVPGFAVRRPRLEQLLDEGRRHPVTLVAAPAGYGKSVLLAQWAAAQPSGSVAWLTIDEGDADPVRLGSHLVAALEPAVDSEILPLVGDAGGGLGDAFVTRLLHDLAAAGGDLTIVLDDFDRLAGPSVDDLARLVADAPPHVRFVISCRADPALPLHRARVRGALVEARAADLRFTTAEAHAAGEAIGGEALTEEEVDQLVEVTEGWPVAVRLATIALRAEAGARRLVDLAASDRALLDYLSSEVLNRTDASVRDFLFDVAVLDTVSGDLVDAVTGRDDSARRLAHLFDEALFVERIPGEPGWYRLHRLMRDILRQDLRDADPARVARLLDRAADWWLEHDDPATAATYLARARAWDRLVDLIDRYGHVEWDRAAARVVLGWVESIPEPVRRPNVRLRLIEAGLHLILGDTATCAAAVAGLERDATLTPGEQVVADTIMCLLVVATSPQADTLERAERVLDTVGEIDPADLPDVLIDIDVHSITALAASGASRARILLGDGRAADDAERGLGSPERTARVARVHALGTAALVEALRGRSGRASAAATLAQDIAAGGLDEHHPATMFWRMAMAVDARMRDDLDAAYERAEGALEIARRWRRWPWAAFLLGEQALVELARGAPDAARACTRRAAQFPMSPPGPLVEGRFRAVALRIDEARHRTADVWAAVEPGSVGGSWELATAAVLAAVRRGEVGRARKFVDAWPAAAAPFGVVEHELCAALVERAEGAEDRARDRAIALVGLAEHAATVRPYLDGGEPVIALFEDVARRAPDRRVEELLARLRRARAVVTEIVDPLSHRELEVLAYLPTRLSNADIAAALFVSTNTVKTHVRHIYQKLGAADRDDAVAIARARGLL